MSEYFSKIVMQPLHFSFWGFFAKDNNPDQAEYLDKLENFYRIITSKAVSDFYPVNDDHLLIHYSEKEGMERADGKSNVIIGINVLYLNHYV